MANCSPDPEGVLALLTCLKSIFGKFLPQECSDVVLESDNVLGSNLVFEMTCYLQGRINHSGAPYQRKTGALSSPQLPFHYLPFKSRPS